MLKKIVDEEIKKFNSQGYSVDINLSEIIVDSTEKVISLGADTAIISGIFFDEDMLTNNDRIFVTSVGTSIAGNAKRIASMGVNIHRTMKQYIRIKRTSDNTTPFAINFVRISPKFN